MYSFIEPRGFSHELESQFFLNVFGFFGATGTPVLDFWWRLLWVLKPESVLPYSIFEEVNVMYIPQDPPLVLHVLTSWQPALLPVLSPHTVPEVRLLGFELMLSEYLWVRHSTNWAKPGPTNWSHNWLNVFGTKIVNNWWITMLVNRVITNYRPRAYQTYLAFWGFGWGIRVSQASPPVWYQPTTW